jgi:hypothetical protein
MEVLVQFNIFSFQIWGVVYFDLVARRTYLKVWLLSKFEIYVHLTIRCNQLRIWQFILLVKLNNCRMKKIRAFLNFHKDQGSQRRKATLRCQGLVSPEA